VGRRSVSNTTASQARYWILTIPHHEFVPYLPLGISWIRGQLERGVGGFLHWQIVVTFQRAIRLHALKKTFGDQAHAEPTRSNAAEDYVWKDDTGIEGTRFELGGKPRNRNNKADWDSIRDQARDGTLLDIPSDIYVRYYSQLKKIAADHMQPTPMERECVCYWGTTGSGKSHRAWQEAGLLAYPKDPRSKFWDGYRDQEHVVIDEFRGGIDISHMLRWLDKYPVIIEIKGSSVCLTAKKIWITSNICPSEWYPDIDEETRAALLRRLSVIHFTEPFK